MAESSIEERRARPMRRRRFSPLIRRILFLNMAPPVLLAVGLLYLDDYRSSLIAGEFAALSAQAQVFASALGAAALTSNEAAGAGQSPAQNMVDPGGAESPAPDDEERLSRELSRQIVGRLVEPTHARARLFTAEGELLADSRVLGAAGVAVEIAPLPPVGPPPDVATRVFNVAYDFTMNWLPSRRDLPLDPLGPRSSLADYPETEAALRGETATILRARPGLREFGPVQAQMSLSVAAPVQRFKKVLGVLLLTADSGAIEANLRAVRVDIMKVFVFALGVTILISIYLGRTIAQPIRRLALAAERVRRGGRFVGVGVRARPGDMGRPAIPDLSDRDDEIGDLSIALNDMIDALWRRLDAIERFAADVAHEIKNPLTSLKSAVETAARVSDADHRQKLLNVIVDDVTRLDRLIVDISDASRLDAELSREEMQSVDLEALLRTLVELNESVAAARGVKLVFEPPAGPVEAPGIEDRLGQVFRNLIANAISFSPSGGVIRLGAFRRGGFVEVAIEDQGPGVAPDKIEKIFERFYSDRPEGEKFGTHSGLGLSISRQIVSAHGGTLAAENRLGPNGKPAGARFVVRLPVA